MYIGIETPEGRRGGRWVISEPKTAAGKREVAVPDFVQPALRAAIQKHDALGRPANGLLFPARDGVTPLSEACLREAHRRALERIGLEGVTLHDLRRTGATLAARSGATIKELMHRLGHTRPDVAMIYQVADAQRDAAVAASMSALVAPASDRWHVTGELDSGEVVDVHVMASSLLDAIERAGLVSATKLAAQKLSA